MRKKHVSALSVEITEENPAAMTKQGYYLYTTVDADCTCAKLADVANGIPERHIAFTWGNNYSKLHNHILVWAKPL